VEEAELRAVGVVEGKGKVVQVRENLKMLKNNASGVNHNCKIMHDIKNVAGAAHTRICNLENFLEPRGTGIQSLYYKQGPD